MLCSNLADIDVPAQFSQRVAADILARNASRKGWLIPCAAEEGRENSVPSGCGVPRPDLATMKSLPKEGALRLRTDARQVFDRQPVPGPIGAGRGQLFPHRKNPPSPSAMSLPMLATQRVAPNSPQWFNTGLHTEPYGIDGRVRGHFYVDPSPTPKPYESRVLLRTSAAMLALLHPVGR